MGVTNRLGRSVTWLVVFFVRSMFIGLFVALVLGVALYTLNKAVPFAIINPIKVYDAVLEMKRDWPAFEEGLSESDRENHREILGFLKRTDTGALVVIALGFDLGLIIIALQIYLIILVIIMFALYLDDQLTKAAEKRTA